MGVRITGISTPVGGISWEYKEAEEKTTKQTESTGRKILVFISSICGEEKYDIVRAELKEAIEATQLAFVYTFEGKGASTLSANSHYTWELEDSDVCIFLIDNADGITSGVQTEIDIVQKYNKKALYYFCDEKKKEKTALEQKLMGAHFAKSKTVHSFSELSQCGARDVIDDIINIYHHYCRGRIVIIPDVIDEDNNIEVAETEKYRLSSIPKVTLKNVDKCRDYILGFVHGRSRKRYTDKTEKTSAFDEWGLQFLAILFEGESIKRFNVDMYLDILKEHQDEKYFQVVNLRWKAIQAFFADENAKSLEYLDSALKSAKETNQPTWVIKDIMIDLRNQHWNCCTVKNDYSEAPAQIELTESSEELYYPILDRINKTLHEKYIAGLYKKKIQSPYTVTLGNSLDQYGEMLASYLVVSMYNGSLTHILHIYENIKNLLFYLSCEYTDWSFKLNLFKLAIFAGKDTETEGIQASYPELLNKLTSDEALSIINFCGNHPIYCKRLNRRLIAFGAVGYFLDDEVFERFEKSIVAEIITWLSNDTYVEFVGKNIFNCLSGVAYRMSQDMLGKICCQYIDRHYIRWYMKMFRFIADNIDLTKMSYESARSLIEHINRVLDNENEREEISKSLTFLHVLRKQNKELTVDMEKKVAMYFPQYYEGIYKLETTENEIHDMPEFIQKYICKIEKSNETQGKNGVYFFNSIREIETVRTILLYKDIMCDYQTMDRLISAVADTLLISKESISTKLDAISLLICISLKYRQDYLRNKSIYEKIFEQQEAIDVVNHASLSSNIDLISLKIGLLFLYVTMDKDVYCDILELMPYIQGNIATTIAVTNLIVEYLKTTDSVMLPPKVESIVMQNVLQWLNSDNIEIRWNATGIMLTMSRNPENHGIVNRQLVNLIDTNNAYIKTLIMQHIHRINGITKETKDYIISKCKHDADFVVRMACKEMEEKTNN